MPCEPLDSPEKSRTGRPVVVGHQFVSQRRRTALADADLTAEVAGAAPHINRVPAVPERWRS